MATAKIPLSLRGALAQAASAERAPALTAACLIAASGGAVEAQTTLPAVTVDAPVARAKPAAARPGPSHARARAALRAKARQPQRAAPVAAAPAAPSPGPLPTFAQSADANPYADPRAPYKIERLASPKFSEKTVNTPRTITVLSKEAIADKGATTFRDIARTTAGVTLGTGEGGNAFGDRFFIRGFDARNDVFVDGVRDPAVSVRENFFTEQVEILRGPASSFAGRGTAGGAINIVSKKAALDRDFANVEASGSLDTTKRVTIDVNKALSPLLAVRLNALLQDGKVAGRDHVDDDRKGLAASVVFKPIEPLTLTFDYVRTDLRGKPDFGAPYDRMSNRPFTEWLVPRNTWYGFVNRDFQKVRQEFITFGGEYRFNEHLTLSTRLRRSDSLLDYVGTLAERPDLMQMTVRAGPQSRYQKTSTLASQTDATLKFDTGPIKHTAVFGVEVSRENVYRDSYTGLASELSPGGALGSGAMNVNLIAPPNLLPFFNTPTLRGLPNIVPVDTKSAYLIETANWRDMVFLNAGLRYDDYRLASYTPTSFAQNHSRMLNYNVGLLVKPTPNLSLYGAFATSSNPVGAELDGTAVQYGGINAASQIFAPERNRAFELGAKWEAFDRRLLITAALFRTEKSNAREVVGGNVTADAAYRVEGLDLALAGNITDKWSVQAGLVLMNSKILRSSYPTNVGLKLANVAHQSFNLLTKYKIGDMFEVGGQASYVSRIYGGSMLAANGGPAFNATGLPAPTLANPYLNVPTILPSHWRFDAFTEAKINKNFSMKLAATNIFNRTYYDAFYQTAAPFVMVAPGRTITLSVRGKF